jgi:hypothetical protein
MQRWQEWRAAPEGSGDAGTSGDALDFERDILPHLANVSLAVLMETTGLSRRYCWLIKTGQKVPHKRLWQTLSTFGCEPAAHH